MVLVGPRRLELQNFALPDRAEDDGLLRVEGTGICGSDWGPYAGKLPFELPPMVLGHEVVGRVEHVGPVAAARWQVAVGDRVVVEEVIPCGSCVLCRTGRYRMCDGLFGKPGRRYGMVPVDEAPHIWGGYGDFMYLHPNSIVHKISPSLPLEVAPLYIPIANGLDWVQNLGHAATGETVVILGPGQHGLGCVIAAREAGAGQIIVAGTARDARRLEVARSLGATHTVDVDADDLVEAVAEQTGGTLADLVLDVTNAPGAATSAFGVARTSGTVVLAGIKNFVSSPDFKNDDIVFKNLTVLGAYSHGFSSVRSAIHLLESGRYPFHVLSSHTFPLDQANEALETLGGERGSGALHITIVCET